MVLISVLIGIGYIFYLNGSTVTRDPYLMPYNKLFNSQTYLLHLIGSFIIPLAIVAVLNLPHKETAMMFVPATYLILFRIADRIVLMKNRRHIILGTGKDKFVPEKNWIDYVFAFVILLASIFIPALIIIRKGE